MVVSDRSKLLCAPVFNAVPARVQVRGEDPSAVPLVRVKTIVPLCIASLNVYETSELAVTLLMYALVAGAVAVMVGAGVTVTVVETLVEEI